MKKKSMLLILLVLIIGYFSLTIYWDFIKLSEDGTSLDYITEAEREEGAKEEEIQEEIPEIQEPKTASATLLAVGDIMFHMPQNNAALDLDNGIYDFKDNFKYVKKYIQSADLSIANFETVVLQGKPYSGFPRFNSPVETLIAIKEAGFNILTTANNHCLDQGKAGLINTIDAIEDLDMKNIGTYREPKEDLLIEDINGVKIALLAYTYGFNGMEYTLTGEEKEYMVSEIDEDKIREDINRAKDLDSDIVAVFIHWGHEYHNEPSDGQIELGKKMIEWGANIIFGSHPHVVQKSEVINYNGRKNFIIYSMGNFLSNQRLETMDNEHTEDGIMIKIQLEKDLDNNNTIIKDIEYIPTWVRKYKTQNKIQYEILPVEEFLQNNMLYNTLEEQEQIRLKESYKRTMEKISKY